MGVADRTLELGSRFNGGAASLRGRSGSRGRNAGPRFGGRRTGVPRANTEGRTGGRTPECPSTNRGTGSGWPGTIPGELPGDVPRGLLRATFQYSDDLWVPDLRGGRFRAESRNRPFRNERPSDPGTGAPSECF